MSKESNPLHTGGIETHIRTLQSDADFRGVIREVGSQPLGEAPGAYVVFPSELASPRSPPDNPSENQGTKGRSEDLVETPDWNPQVSPELAEIIEHINAALKAEQGIRDEIFKKPEE